LDGRSEPEAETPDADTRDGETPAVDAREGVSPAVESADGEIGEDNTPEKELAVKEGNAQLSGDETTPQMPQAPQPQYPKPEQQAPPTIPTATNGLAAVNATGAVKPEAAAARAETAVRADTTKTERDSTQPQQAKIKKKSHDER
jgi:hypothetical protein